MEKKSNVKHKDFKNFATALLFYGVVTFMVFCTILFGAFIASFIYHLIN